MAFIKADLDQIEVTEYYLRNQYDNMISKCQAINGSLNSLKRWKGVENDIRQFKCNIGMNLLMREASKINTYATYLYRYLNSMRSAQSVMLSLLRYLG